ncbi:MAG: hypothetical protein KGI97_08180, partial [Alphaproteobacteria bacterium]|nr:hypothetical protein [Alphaproteobacteria bacterium]
MFRNPLFAAPLFIAVLCAGSAGAAAAPAQPPRTPQAVVAPTPLDSRFSAPAAPTVRVRTGAHKGYDRIVFDWPHNVRFRAGHKDGRGFIIFDARGDLRLPKGIEDGLTRAHGFRIHKKDGKVTVDFTVAPGAAIDTFANGHSIVLDIKGRAAPQKTAIASTPPKPAHAAATSAVKPESASAEPVAATAEKAAAAPAAPAQAPVQPVMTSEEPPAAKATPPAKLDASAFPTLSAAPLLVAAFDPQIPARVVIYDRADTGYIVFERKFGMDVKTLADGGPLPQGIRSLDLPDNSGYSFPLPPNAELHATRDGTAWKIYVSQRESDVPVATMLVPQPDFALGARFVLPLPDAPTPIRITDPVVGDDLILVPLKQSEAFSVGRDNANFRILSAAQGLVIKPLTDKLIVRDVSDGIEITSDGGLQMSPPLDTGLSQQSPSKARAEAAGKSLFAFAAWAGKPDETFTQTRQRLQQTIVDVPEAERNRARLELARFYFAHGNGAEAMGLLKMLVKKVPDLAAHADFRAVLGASEILAYRPEEGLKEFDAPQLTNQPESELWQAIGLAEERDWPDAEEKFATTESILTGYPEPFFSRFMVLAIESAVAAGKDHEA